MVDLCHLHQSALTENLRHPGKLLSRYSSLIPQKLVAYLQKTLLSESLIPILTRALDPANWEVPDSGSAWLNISDSTTARTLSDSAAMIFTSLNYTESPHVVHQWLISQVKSYRDGFIG